MEPCLLPQRIRSEEQVSACECLEEPRRGGEDVPGHAGLHALDARRQRRHPLAAEHLAVAGHLLSLREEEGEGGERKTLYLLQSRGYRVT